MLVSLCQSTVLNRSQGVIDFDEVFLTVVLQDQGVEVQLDPVARVSPKPPLQVYVRWVGGVWKPWRLDDSSCFDMDVEGLLHWKKNGLAINHNTSLTTAFKTPTMFCAISDIFCVK